MFKTVSNFTHIFMIKKKIKYGYPLNYAQLYYEIYMFALKII